MTERRPRGTASGMRSRHIGRRPKEAAAKQSIKEAKRKQRQRIVMRNRAIFGAGCIAVAALVIFLLIKLFGFILDLGKTAETTTITFNSDGKVVFEEVVDFDTDTYSKSDLKSESKDLIEAFNKKQGKDVVSLDRVKMKKDKVYVKSTYDSPEVYTSFTTYETFDDTYENAVEAGYKFANIFSQVKDGKKSQGQILDAASLFVGKRVAIVNENCTVVVPGTIEYVSDSSTEIVDASTVKIAPKDGNEDATETVYIIYNTNTKK
ncbi:MAG: hypothetical protein K6D38_04755 [Pseudobutyrivibrio sp.]|nr:hypothetical protein [Pseudobutyrivibrio sp.]